MKNNIIYAWSSDFEDFTGEGILARNYLNKVLGNYKVKIKIKSNNSEYVIFNNKIKKIRSSKYKNNFVNKYIKLFLGILYIRRYNARGYKTLYINYLPLWNFLIFLFLPKNTYLGPITGGKYIVKSLTFNAVVRKYMFPILFKLSSLILEKKNINLLFSTNMLKDYLTNKILKNSIFELNLICFEPKRRKKKDIDFLFYYRIHANKSNYFMSKLINRLADNKKKIYVVGDKFPNHEVKNLGNIKRELVLEYLSRTKFSLNSGENFYSLFALDCISNHVTLFVDKKSYVKKNYFLDKNIYPLNLNKFSISYETICKKIIKQKIFFNNFTLINKKKKYLVNNLKNLINFK